jgi:D-3-phosphoglycerate dehydrogenase
MSINWTTSDGKNVQNNSSYGVDVKTNIDEILPICDYISLHVPKQSNGNSVIGRNEFELMKNGVRIINTSRGGVVNELELIEYLNNGKVAGAALDVFENEPTPLKELLSHSNILCTPHIGAATVEAQDRIGSELAELIIAEFGKQN